jgi:hypothetical protein
MTVKNSRIGSFDDADIALLDLDTGEWKTIVNGGSCGRWLAAGSMVYARAGELLGVTVDVTRGEVRGAPVPLMKGVMTDPGSGAAQFALARDAGAIVYVPGGPSAPRRRLAWLDRSGSVESIAAPLRYYRGAELSPDGARVATTVLGATDGVFVFDLLRGVLGRTTEQGNCAGPVWLPDGEHLLYESDRAGQRGLFMCRPEGADDRRVGILPPGDILQAVSHAGEVALLIEHQGDIWLAGLDHLDQPQRVIGSRFHEHNAAVSPDGAWIAYSSDESGASEVYVSRFQQAGLRPQSPAPGFDPGPAADPDPGAEAGMGVATVSKSQVSVGGGDRPRWGPGSDEIVYANDNSLYSARLSTAGEWAVQPPVLLLTHEPQFGVHRLHPDGLRFLAIERLPPEFPGVEIRAVFNWLPAAQGRLAGPGAGAASRAGDGSGAGILRDASNE